MQVDFEDGWTSGRYIIRTKDGEAVSTFSKAGEKIVITDHTEVDDALRGLGYGEVLMEHIVTDMRSQGKKIVPLCPFAASQFRKHPEWADMLN
ncbi:N-acetyltransferase [Litorivita pollutaquae]|uniref:N-acetyltransferase n=1 Tax=Litorivita pollutaquae TaxID=2200892 RepID=A0A2V4MMI9_9RHOB|nr:GNAT family N-acetyltransferase [Litorivita pollutaquae]PYC47921.1 N-acetyltransferase [Litorivita pollutaquae]